MTTRGENTDAVEVVVLGDKIHGLPPSEYAVALRERLPDCEVRVARTPSRERALVETATVVTGIDFDPDLLEAAENLRLFGCAYAGYNHLPLEAFEEAGVVVTSASGVHTSNVAEQTVGFVLTFARRLHEGWRRQQRREWRSYPTHELAGSTVTIVGMGAIGEGVARRLEGFEVNTIGVRHTPSKGGPVGTVLGYDDLHEGLARADYLVLACPLTDETEGLIGERELETLPPEAVVVNVARGEVIDTEALVSALRSNLIRGAGLDVTDPEPLPEDHPLWGFENVLVTPHNAGFTPAYHDRLADIVAENVDVLTGGEDGDREFRNRVV